MVHYPMYLVDTNEIVRNYEEYLQSRHWAIVRLQFAQLFPRICIRCESPVNLNIHHLTYEHIGRELPWELVYLCERCHKKVHIELNYQRQFYRQFLRQQKRYMRLLDRQNQKKSGNGR